MISDYTMDLAATAGQALGTVPLPPRPSKAVAQKIIDLCIELGQTRIDRDSVQELRAGAVVPLDNAAGDPVDVYANGKLIARGEVLVLDGKIGIRVTETMLAAAKI